MQPRVEIENIEELRRREGIEDTELEEAIRALRVGDFVKLTLLSGSALTGETLSVRITRIRDGVFRGKLARRPTSAGLSQLPLGAPLTFTRGHIHSIAKRPTAGR